MFNVNPRGLVFLPFAPEVTVLEEAEAKHPYPFRQAYQRVKAGRSVAIGIGRDGKPHLYRRMRQALKANRVAVHWRALRKDTVPLAHYRIVSASPFLHQGE